MVRVTSDTPVGELAELMPVFGIGRSKLYEAANKGELPIKVFRIGRHFRFLRADLDRFLAGEHEPPDDGGAGADQVAGLA